MIPIIAICVTCLLTGGAGPSGTSLPRSPPSGSNSRGVAKSFDGLRDELHETRAAQHDYTAAIAEQVQRQATEIALLQQEVHGSHKKASGS